SSKLLVLERETGNITHSHYYDLWKFLKAGDVLVRNNSKVINARLKGVKASGGAVEVLLNKEVSREKDSVTWECLTKPGLKVGQQVSFGDLKGVCVDETGYTRQLKFFVEPEEFFSVLEKVGEVPLPPYIEAMSSKKIAEQYQTTYAQFAGSVAAPTAGLHFTAELDKKLREVGVVICEVTLHVGLGTFLPVKTENITEHTMHEEVFSLSTETAEVINAAKNEGRRVIAVGTTSTRVLEALINQSVSKTLFSTSGSTDIYMFPPRKFECIDGLITNFHLPKSTLLMLVSAFVSSPNTKNTFTSFDESVVGNAYVEALAHNYRFFSFGDGMLII
ncbi:MAG: S-adenosylmethionine:tRNA ribosyltransferase-isomerase, partial [Candidatus Dependentiae bacterium]|nr:S-adenosylmethionine:tRNA ribosyltransferase-isomerase [Candidatus Dependentiae bacterium]